MTKASSPHQAFVLIRIEVRELLPTGEASSKMMSKDELEKEGINISSLLVFNGKNRAECIKNLKKKLEGF